MSQHPQSPIALFETYGAPVYPGHPVTLACYALIEADTLAEALVPAGQGHTLVSAKTVAAAHDAIQATAAMLGRLQRGEAVDTAVKWAGDWWARAIRAHRPAFDHRLEPGREQAGRMEELFRELIAAARERAAALAPEPAPEPAAEPAQGPDSAGEPLAQPDRAEVDSATEPAPAESGGS